MPDPGGPIPAVPAKISVPATRAATSARAIRLFIIKLLGLCRSTRTVATIMHAMDLAWTFGGHLLTFLNQEQIEGAFSLLCAGEEIWRACVCSRPPHKDYSEPSCWYNLHGVGCERSSCLPREEERSSAIVAGSGVVPRVRNAPSSCSNVAFTNAWLRWRAAKRMS